MSFSGRNYHFTCQLCGASRTSIQQGHAVTSCLEYLGPHPLAKDIRTDLGSTGPICGKVLCGSEVGRQIQRQCAGATLHTSKALAAAASSAGELTNTGSRLRLYNQTPSDSKDNRTPKPIFARVLRTWNLEKKHVINTIILKYIGTATWKCHDLNKKFKSGHIPMVFLNN